MDVTKEGREEVFEKKVALEGEKEEEDKEEEEEKEEGTDVIIEEELLLVVVINRDESPIKISFTPESNVDEVVYEIDAMYDGVDV